MQDNGSDVFFYAYLEQSGIFHLLWFNNCCLYISVVDSLSMRSKILQSEMCQYHLADTICIAHHNLSLKCLFC